MSDETLTPDAIWEDDLFGRKAEAELLMGYLETVSAIPSLRQDHQGFTLAVDARYGEGKTFFLKRLAKHLSINHPVAFVDAWADDLADEPLTALAATLKRALDPLIEQSPDIRLKFEDVVEKSGRIAKIVATGLAKKALGLAITTGGAEMLGDAISGMGKDSQEAVRESMKTAGTEAVDGTIKAFNSVAPGKLMDERISAFEDGQAAIREMKESLAALVEALEPRRLNRPIFIIIDELDRCRPTYAVKLLEEIKHLFDVAGIVFILGLHGDQLSHSISAAYGSGFDSKAYLRRFFNRQYRLAEPDLERLLEKLCADSGLDKVRLHIPAMIRYYESANVPLLSTCIARYMSAYGLSARASFEFVDILQTCVALANGPLHLTYLLPLIVGHIQGLKEGELPKQTKANSWLLFVKTDHFGREGDEVTFSVGAEHYDSAIKLSQAALQEAVNNNPSTAIRAVYNSGQSDYHDEPIWSLRNYPRLLSMVKRFSNPNLPR